MNLLTAEVREQFRAHADGLQAEAMERYMKNLFPFHGIKRPLRNTIQKQLFRQHNLIDGNTLCRIAEELWEGRCREEHYCALDLLCAGKKHLKADDLSVIERLIRQKSWWDTVDLLATHVVGYLVAEYGLWETMDRWIEDDCLWVRRSALLFQLKHKQHTDSDRLFSYCIRCMPEKEFFIRKAIGWALREYSKVQPSAVKGFVGTHRNSLSPLSIREALRLLE